MKQRCQRFLWLSIATVILAGDAFATDRIGIFFDPDATTTCVAGSLATPCSAYLIILDPSAPSGISGWEGQIESDPGLFVTVAEYYGSCVDVAPGPDFAVRLAKPLPAAAHVVLARLTVFATKSGGLKFGPASLPAAGGTAAPLYFDADHVPHALSPASGRVDEPMAIIGCDDCGVYRKLTDIADPRRTSLVVIPDATPQPPDFVARFPHGSAVGEFGYHSSAEGASGVADFALGADGRTYLLDHLNERIVVLDQDLSWAEAIPIGNGYVDLKERDGRLFMAHRSMMWADVWRTPTGWEMATHAFGPGQHPPEIRKAEPFLTLGGARLNSTLFRLDVGYSCPGFAAPGFSWDIQLPRPASGISMLIEAIINDGVLLSVAYGDFSNLDMRVFAMAADGAVIKSMRPPSTAPTNYRLAFTTKAGLDGSVVSVLIYDDRTEITKWRW